MSSQEEESVKTPRTSTENQEKSTKPSVTKKNQRRCKPVDEIDADRMMKNSEKIHRLGLLEIKEVKGRQARKEEKGQQQQELNELESGIIEVTEFITANDLAEELEVSVTDIISACMSIGLMITINQRLDAGTIELVSEEFGKEVKFVDAEEMVEEFEEEIDDEADLKNRAPIIT